MSSRQECDLHFYDVFVTVQTSFENGREFAWYLPYETRLQQKCLEGTTNKQRLLLHPQAEFCAPAPVILKEDKEEEDQEDSDEEEEGDEEGEEEVEEVLNQPSPEEYQGGFSPSETAVDLPSISLLRRDPTQYWDKALEINEREVLGFLETIDDNSMSVSHVTHTASDGKLRTRGSDTYLRPDFVGFFRKETKSESIDKAKPVPWLIVEIKPYQVDGDEWIRTDNGFGPASRDAAAQEIVKTLGQALSQAKLAFGEYQDVNRLIVLICAGAFFEFFIVYRPSNRQCRDRRLQEYRLLSFVDEKVVDNDSDMTPKCLFSEDLSGFNPEFDRLWNAALRKCKLQPKPKPKSSST